MIDTGTATKAADRAVTLYSAIATEFGLKFQDSTLVATNHQQLTDGIRWTYASLDNLSGTRTETWAMNPERTEEEVLNLLTRATATHPVTPYDDVKAQHRPGTTKLLGRGKFRSAIACEAARVGKVTGLGFSQALGSALAASTGDMGLLLWLEAIPGEVTVKDIDWTLPSAWVDAAGVFFEGDDPNWQLRDFCLSLTANWADIDDLSLLTLVESVRAHSRKAQKSHSFGTP